MKLGNHCQYGLGLSRLEDAVKLARVPGRDFWANEGIPSWSESIVELVVRAGASDYEGNPLHNPWEILLEVAASLDCSVTSLVSSPPEL